MNLVMAALRNRPCGAHLEEGLHRLTTAKLRGPQTLATIVAPPGNWMNLMSVKLDGPWSDHPALRG